MKKSVYTKTFIIAVVSTVYLCKDPDASALSALSGQGYSDVKLEEGGLFTCDRHDAYVRRFKAVKDSIVVKGCICSGHYKGFKVRALIETSLNQ
jgi:hypothetical protein